MGTERRGTPSDPDWSDEPPAGELEGPALPADVPPEPAAAEHPQPGTMLPGRERRRTKAERGLMRLIATLGIIGIDVALGAILVSQDVAGWITGLVIGTVSVVLAAILWSSRQL
jgi:hypothetical protein